MAKQTSDARVNVSQEQRQILLGVALFEPVNSRSKLTELLRAMDLSTTRGTAFTAQQVKVITEDLRGAGHLVSNPSGMDMQLAKGGPDWLSEASPQELAALERRLSGRREQGVDGSMIARGRVALRRGDVGCLSSLLVQLRNWQVPAWQVLVPSAASSRLLASIPERFVDDAAREMIVYSLLDLRPVSPHWGEALPRVSTANRLELTVWFAWSRGLAGDLDGAASLLEPLSSNATVETTRAGLLLLRGDIAGARAVANQACQLVRVGRQRKVRLSGPAAPLARLLLVTGETEHRRWLADWVVDPHKQSHLGNAERTVSKLAERLTRGVDLDFDWPHGDRLDLALVFQLLAAACHWQWTSPAALGASMWTPMVGRVQAQAAAAGYSWLADELTRSQAVLVAGAGESVLSRLHEPRPAWREVIELLDRAAQTPEPSAEGGEAPAWQLAWTVQEVSGGVFVPAPLSRKRGARGWGAYRPLALSRLRSLDSSGELSALDRRIIEQLDRYGDHRGMGDVWRAGAIQSLVGNPRVVHPTTHEPLEVQERKPELSLRRSAQGFTLSLVPSAASVTSGAPPALAALEPSRLIVYPLTETHRTLARALERSATALPKEAESALRASLARLGGTVRVSSELELEIPDASVEPADGQLRIALYRASPGLRFTLGVRPFGGEGPLIAAGEGSATLAEEIAGRPRVVRRDLADERQRVDALELACPSLALAERDGWDLRLRELTDCLELLTELGRQGDALRLEWPEGQPLQLLGERDARALRVGVKATNDWFSLQVELRIDEERVLSLQELVERRPPGGGRFVELDGGQIVALTRDLMDKLDRIACAAERKAERFELPALAAPALAAWLEGLDADAAQATVEKQLARYREAERKKFPVPRTLEAELRDYQVSGYEWMRRLAHFGAGGLLCDDMGLGKTVQLLALAAALAKEGPALVVAPTSVCAHWAEQAQRFCPRLRVVRFGEEDRELQLAGLGKGDLLIMSYGHMQRESARLAQLDFALLVLDEAQAIKNPSSQRARAACGLSARYRFASTGTPVENHLLDLWSLFRFVNPGLLGSQERFERRFVRPLQAGGARAVSEALHQLVRPFLLRRRKADVLEELPAKTEITLTVQPNADEVAFYEAIRRDALRRLDASGPKNQGRLQILAALTRLRQAACHPMLAGAPESLGSSAKHETFFALVDELRAGGHRALVFSQFVQHLALIRRELESRSIPYVYLDGSTPAAQRRKRVEAFQDGEGDLFLISLRAGGTGLNLTAADYVIHLDPWWNPAVEAQATDRAHRIGQTRPVTVYRLVTQDTVEQKILALHGEKRATAELLLDGVEAAPLDLEALRHLLE